MEVFGTHIDIVQLLLAVVAFFLTRTLNKIDKNQALLFGKINSVESRLNRLIGAHDANHSGIARRRFGADTGDDE